MYIYTHIDRKWSRREREWACVESQVPTIPFKQNRQDACPFGAHVVVWEEIRLKHECSLRGGAYVSAKGKRGNICKLDNSRGHPLD